MPRLLVPAAFAALATLIGGASLISPSPAYASYPDKPIRVVIGFPAGGPLDQHARLLTDKLQSVLDRKTHV